MYRDNSPALGNTAQENRPDSQVLVASIQPGQAMFKSHVMMPKTTITNKIHAKMRFPLELGVKTSSGSEASGRSFSLISSLILITSSLSYHTFADFAVFFSKIGLLEN